MATRDREKRRSRRLPIHVEVNFSDGKRLFSGFVYDISSGGLQIENPRPCDKEDPLILTFGGFPPLKVRGKLRWSRKSGLNYRMGIEFIELTDAQEARLREIISNLFWESAKA